MPTTNGTIYLQFINQSFAERQGNNQGLSNWAYTWLWSFLLNVWFVGYLVGTFFTPYVNDTYGRKS